MRVGGGRGGVLRLDGRVASLLPFFCFSVVQFLFRGFLDCVATSFLALVFGVGGDGFLR